MFNNKKITVVLLYLILGSLFNPYLLSASVANPANNKLKKRVQSYYEYEKQKKWDQTYLYRTPLFRKTVGFKLYYDTMNEDDRGWILLHDKIISIEVKNNLAKVEILFTEKIQKKFLYIFLRNKTIQMKEMTLWELINGEWYIRDPGSRQHLSLNVDLVQKESYGSNENEIKTNGFIVTSFSKFNSITKSSENNLHPLTDITTVAAAWLHTIALKKDGSVWMWGYNVLDQIRDETRTDSVVPIEVKGLTGVTAIASGEFHTVILKKDGTVWAWGINWFGDLGDGTEKSRFAPIQVKRLTGGIAIAAGAQHTVALKRDGTVWAWGNNEYGQLGDGTRNNSSTPVQVKGLTNIIAIAAGAQHTVALKRDGAVWAWGDNEAGQLGDGTKTNKYTPVQVENRK